jgi:hypothetical protein
VEKAKREHNAAKLAALAAVLEELVFEGRVGNAKVFLRDPRVVRWSS